MKTKPKEPFIPPERSETVRQAIVEVIEGRTCSAREISAEVRVSEKEVYEHLEHIQKTASARGYHLDVKPPECKKCGFSFRKREKLKKPGRCPVCRGQSIEEPLFSVRKTSGSS